MKRKNFKKTLTMVSALALSAQLILPTAIFAESESDAAGTVERPGMTARAEEKTFKDDCIFIGSSDTSEDTDKASVKCISFGMHGGREMKYGMPDGEPPEKPDDESNFGETPDREPPEKPDGESNFGEAPDREPPEKAIRILRNFKSLSAKMCVDAPPYKYTLLQPRTYSTQNERPPKTNTKKLERSPRINRRLRSQLCLVL